MPWGACPHTEGTFHVVGDDEEAISRLSIRHAASALDAIRSGELDAFTYPADEHEQLWASLERRFTELLRAVDRGAVAR